MILHPHYLDVVYVEHYPVMIIVLFWPPNPKELLMATLTSALRGLFGT